MLTTVPSNAINKEGFVAAKWATNPHVQTILPRLVRPRPLFEPIWQRIDTPDGDFLDLCWTQPPVTALNKPIVILFHGLAGSFYSPYANGLLYALKQQGLLGLLMHFRGCSGQINRQARSYHSGETSDARFLIKWLYQKYQVPMVAVGVSLGGNMLVRYLAKYKERSQLKAAVAISPPLALAACSEKLQSGFSRFYQAYLLRLMNQNLKAKLLHHSQIGKLTKHNLTVPNSIFEFDDLVTAPLHNFANAKDYYQQCSGINVLGDVSIPLKIIHAKDDPFMTEAVIPKTALPTNIEYNLSLHGGHVGFISGSLCQPVFWLEQVVPTWIAKHL